MAHKRETDPEPSEMGSNLLFATEIKEKEITNIMRSKQQVKESANAEVSISDYLPFGNHVANNVIKLKNENTLLYGG